MPLGNIVWASLFFFSVGIFLAKHIHITVYFEVNDKALHAAFKVQTIEATLWSHIFALVTIKNSD